MLKALAIGFGLAMGFAAGGAAVVGGLMYVGSYALEDAVTASLAQVEEAAQAPDLSWQEYGDCRLSNSADACKALRPDARKEAATRGRDYAAYVEDVCHERLDVSMGECIMEFYPN